MYHFSTIGKTRKHNIDYSIQAFWPPPPPFSP
jgi:hypothetical protein